MHIMYAMHPSLIHWNPQESCNVTIVHYEVKHSAVNYFVYSNLYFQLYLTAICCSEQPSAVLFVARTCIRNFISGESLSFYALDIFPFREG